MMYIYKCTYFITYLGPHHMQTQNSMQKCHFKEPFSSSFRNNFKKDLPVRCTTYAVYASSERMTKSIFLVDDQFNQLFYIAGNHFCNDNYTMVLL